MSVTKIKYSTIFTNANFIRKQYANYKDHENWENIVDSYLSDLYKR